MMAPMPYYERLFPVAVLTCLAAGAWSFAQADALGAAHDFLAAAFGLRLDDRLRRPREDDAREPWQRLRTPV